MRGEEPVVGLSACREIELCMTRFEAESEHFVEQLPTETELTKFGTRIVSEDPPPNVTWLIIPSHEARIRFEIRSVDFAPHREDRCQESCATGNLRARSRMAARLTSRRGPGRSVGRSPAPTYGAVADHPKRTSTSGSAVQSSHRQSSRRPPIGCRGRARKAWPRAFEPGVVCTPRRNASGDSCTSS